MDEPLDPTLLGALLGLIAHDLRNPLSALQSNVAFVRGTAPADDTDVHEALLDAQASCQGVADIVDNVELVAYVLRGRPAVELGSMRIAPVVSEVAAKLADTAISHETSIQLDGIEEYRELQVVSNRDMLVRALANLIKNGIQHGGRRPVQVRLAGDGKLCRVQISDHGPALAGELALAAFSAAGQLMAKSARGGRYGRGLGLYCASVASDAIGAAIRVADGAPGFELCVPVAQRA